MHPSLNLVMTILLYIIGIMLVMAAIILLLRGLGWLPKVPAHVLWSLILLGVGGGILGGLRRAA